MAEADTEPSTEPRLRTAVTGLLSGPVTRWLAMAIPYAAWGVTDLAEVVVAFAESHYRMGATWTGWQTSAPVVRWVFAIAGLTVAAGRTRASGIDVSGRLRSGGLFLVCALIARILSLLDPIGYVFPWLGMLWSPAASWTTALFTAVWPNLGLPVKRETGLTAKRAALGVFALFGLVYVLYGIYFVKTTPLHGDEPQYLLITQSLLEDGDIDLLNADKEAKLRFHAFDFDVHRAPASPSGRIYSSHPIGLPLLLMAPYEVGARLWGHPRLASVLLQAVLTAAACGLLVVFLIRFGVSAPVAAVTALLTGSSAPLLTQSNQLYPEIQAVLAALYILALFPKWPWGEERTAALHLAGAAAAIVVLPFFHQRHLILSVLLALPLIDTLRRVGPSAKTARAPLAIFGVGILGHLLYNFHFSGDPWGPFLPGNADRLGPDFRSSIPGQWIDQHEGLLRQSPIYVLALIGWIRMAVYDRRRILLPAALLAATAGVNTLSSDWSFGYCYPARFMVAAVPALALGLAEGLSATRRATATWLVLAGSVLGLETVHQSALLPEIGFDGMNLVSRISERFYPWALHFPDYAHKDAPDLGVLAFWFVVGLSVIVILTCRQRAVTGIGWMLAALAPLLTSSAMPYSFVMAGSGAYQVLRFGADPEIPYIHRVDLDISYGPSDDPAYTSSMPPLFRGEVRAVPAIPVVPNVKGVRAFHTYANTTDGLNRSGTRRTIPLINSTRQSAHRFRTAGTAVSKQYHYPLGTGVEPNATRWLLTAKPLDRLRETVFREDVTHFPPERPIVITLDGFEAGDYALRLEREGIPWSDWFSRGQAGTVVGIFTGFDRVRTTPDGLAKMGDRWLEGGWRDLSKPLPREYFPPQVEARVPFFRSLLPWDTEGLDVDFSLERAGPVHLVVVPDPDVRVTGLRIDRIAARGVE